MWINDNFDYDDNDYIPEGDGCPECESGNIEWNGGDTVVKDDVWQCIPTAWIIEAQNRWIANGKPDVKLRSVGVDPSRGGDDDNVGSASTYTYVQWFTCEDCGHKWSTSEDYS